MNPTPQPLAAFVHPGLAWAALALGLIPILIHLWNRRRYRRVPWAAMRFLIAANRRTARRLWFERMLLLLIRLAVICLFGLAVARPYLQASTLMVTGGSRVHRVIVLDDSLSMTAVDASGVSRFDRARAALVDLVASFPEQDGISLVRTAEPAEAVFDDAVYDRRILRDRIEAHTVTQRRDDVVGALQLVRDILNESDAPPLNRVVYVVSDLPRTQWGDDSSARESAALGALDELAGLLGDREENLVIVPVGEPRARNLAVSALSVESPLAGVDLPVVLNVGVSNFGDESVRDVRLVVSRQDKEIRAHTFPRIDPGATEWFRIQAVFPRAGTHGVAARLMDHADALAADDARYLSVQITESTPLLIVDGRPGARLLDGEAGFLATALAPGKTATSGGHSDEPITAGIVRVSPLDPQVVSEPALASEPLDSYQTIALSNVPRLSPAQWQRIEGFVRRGGGLLITVGDLVDTAHYIEHGYRDGSGLLPFRFGDRPLHVAEPTGVHISGEALIHPIVEQFTGLNESGLFSARVNRFLLVEPDYSRSEVVLSYSTGAPALVTGRCGSGRIAVLTTSADLDWTNLPAKGDFVSLMYNTVAYVTPDPGRARNLSIGESLVEPLDAASALLPIEARSPDGGEARYDLLVVDEAYSVRVGPMDSSGLHQLNMGPTVYDIAVNPEVSESHLQAAGREVFSRRLSGGFRWLEDVDTAVLNQESARATELSFAMLCMVALLLLAESFVAWWSGSADRTGDS